MGNLASPLQVASVLVWPLLAGLGVVFWSRARAAAHARRVAAMDGQLKGLYRTLQAKPLPARLAMVVEALEEGEELAPVAPGKRAARKPVTRAGS